jgi:hypothetical protein
MIVVVVPDVICAVGPASSFKFCLFTLLMLCDIVFPKWNETQDWCVLWWFYVLQERYVQMHNCRA